MKIWQQRLKILLIASVMTVWTAGCGTTSKTTEKTITILASEHPWLDAVKPLLPEFEAKTGIKVRLSSVIEDQLTSKLTVPLTGEWPAPDVFMYRPLQEGKFLHKNGWIEPLEERIAKDSSFDRDDFAKSALGTAAIDGKLYGVPLVTEQEILYYRKDLLQKADLPVPKTIQDLEQAAKKLHDPARGIYGFVARGQQSALVTQASSFLYSEGGDFTSGNKATLNTPEAVLAFGTYGRLLRNFAPADAVKWSWPQAMDWFAQGKAAFYTDASSIYQNAANRETSKIADTIGYAPFPSGKAGSKPYNVTQWVLGMNAYSEHEQEAWEFMSWAVSKEIVLKIQQKGVPGARNSVWAKPEGTKGFPPELVDVIRQSAQTGIDHDRPVVMNVGDARTAAGAIVQAAIRNEDVQAAADAANQSLQAILDQEKLK